MVKQEYTQTVKKNITLTECNVKLEKKRMDLIKELEEVKKERIQMQFKYDELHIENESMLKELQKKGKLMEEMSNKVTMKEN